MACASFSRPREYLAEGGGEELGLYYAASLTLQVSALPNMHTDLANSPKHFSGET
jgi:hypothetical protein